MPKSHPLVLAARALNRALKPLTFDAPVTHVYNPYEYASAMHQTFVETYGNGRKKTLLLGMNPGPWGMAQTGVPFGEVSFVRDWLKLDATIKKPANEHPKRPIEGLACARSEVSGARLWGAISDKYKDPHAFFEDFFVVNYCPLMFMEETGRNRTPDKLPKAEREPVEAACDRHLVKVVEILEPELIIGVGVWAKKIATRALSETKFADTVEVKSLLHPSPASPKANAGWVKGAREDIVKHDLPRFI